MTEPKRTTTRTATAVLLSIVGEHSTGEDERRWSKTITCFMNAVRDTGEPESSVPGTTDRQEEKSIDSGIQYICMLRRNGASERSRVSETRDDYSRQSTVK